MRDTRKKNALLFEKLFRSVNKCVGIQKCVEIKVYTNILACPSTRSSSRTSPFLNLSS